MAYNLKKQHSETNNNHKQCIYTCFAELKRMQ